MVVAKFSYFTVTQKPQFYLKSSTRYMSTINPLQDVSKPYRSSDYILHEGWSYETSDLKQSKCCTWWNFYNNIHLLEEDALNYNHQQILIWNFFLPLVLRTSCSLHLCLMPYLWVFNFSLLNRLDFLMIQKYLQSCMSMFVSICKFILLFPQVLFHYHTLHKKCLTVLAELKISAPT